MGSCRRNVDNRLIAGGARSVVVGELGGMGEIGCRQLAPGVRQRLAQGFEDHRDGEVRGRALGEEQLLEIFAHLTSAPWTWRDARTVRDIATRSETILETSAMKNPFRAPANVSWNGEVLQE